MCEETELMSTPVFYELLFFWIYSFRLDVLVVFVNIYIKRIFFFKKKGVLYTIVWLITKLA